MHLTTAELMKDKIADLVDKWDPTRATPGGNGIKNEARCGCSNRPGPET